jgi:hypothetical protein
MFFNSSVNGPDSRSRWAIAQDQTPVIAFELSSGNLVYQKFGQNEYRRVPRKGKSEILNALLRTGFSPAHFEQAVFQEFPQLILQSILRQV